MAILTKGQTFANGVQVTSTKLNNLVDAATFRTGVGEATDGTTLLVDAGGYLKAGTMQTGNLATGSVTTAKIADSSGAADGVTTAKLATGAVTTAKLADLNVTAGKLAADAVETAKILNANVTAAKLSGAQTGAAPAFGVRAYGSFDGTGSTPHTPVKAGNVTSISRTGTGIWLVTLATAMESTAYTVVANATHESGSTFGSNCWVEIVSASTFNVKTSDVSGGAYNSALVNFVVLA